MYSRTNKQYTSINSSQKKHKLQHLLICFFLILTLCGCKKDSKASNQFEITEEPVVTTATTPTPAPTTSPSLEPTPTIKPSASITLGEEISVQTAKALLEDAIDTNRYSISLLSEDIEIESNYYIAFTATEHAIPVEPILIVNKFSGKIACMSSEGKYIAFSNFPLKKRTDLSDYNWSGTYCCKDKSERIISTLQITQNDPSSFEFMIHIPDTTDSVTLAGIGHIDCNYAIFTDENNNELVFEYKNEVITLYDDEEVFSKNGLSIAGLYVFDSTEISENYRITKEQAINLISNLNTYQSQLPAAMSEYTLKIKEQPVIVGDYICYVIGAYAKLEKQDILMKTFYISIDGNIAFSYDFSSGTPDSVITFY